jgi:hypothetical protein
LATLFLVFGNWLLQQPIWMSNEVRIDWRIVRHHYTQCRLALASGPANLLPQACG